MKIGIYGGTFDPVHLGHLILAETVREFAGLDQVWFVPANLNPHKQGQAVTPAKARLEMLRFALAGNPYFQLSEIEIRRTGPSYMFETMQSIRQKQAEDELFLMVGADALTDFPQWREPGLILEMAQLIAVNRGREPVAIPDDIPADRVLLCNMPAIEISATSIRDKCANGLSIRYLTPRPVELFIRTNHLYSAKSE